MNKKNLLLVSVFFACLSGQAQHSIKLSELNLSNMWQEYGKVQNGKSVTGEQATINGKVYTEVIGTHAKSILKIDLHKDATRLRSQIGVADSRINTSDKNLAVIPLVNGTKLYFRKDGNDKQFLGMAGTNGKIGKGSVCFIVKGDGKELYNSGVLHGKEAPLSIDVDLKGVSTLELLVDPTDDGASGDNALWIAPTIEYKSSQPETVSAEYAGKGPEMTISVSSKLANKISKLPVLSVPASTKTDFDWLITPEKAKAGIYASADKKSIIVANPMISRTFRIFPNLATTNLINRMTGESMIRAVSSEGSIQIDGKKHLIGGLAGQPERAYLEEKWIENMTTIPESFLVEDFEIVPIKEDIKWARSRWALNKEVATGSEIIFTLRGDKELKDILVKLHVSVYDKIPLIRKRFEVINQSGLPINIDTFQLEYLAFAEPESPVGGEPSKFLLPNIHIESDYACGGSFTEKEMDITEKWVTDPDYTSQRNYLLQTPCILDVSPKMGPDQSVPSNSSFQSFSVYEMPFDSYDRERKGLFTRKLYRTIAP